MTAFKSCPNCRFKETTVKELIEQLKKVKDKKKTVWITSTIKDGHARPFLKISEVFPKSCIYLVATSHDSN